MKNVFLFSVILTATAHAQVRTSENFGYAITTDTLDFGGQLITSSSPDYSIQSSMGPVNGVSESNSPIPTVVRHGYIGQLYDVLGFGILFTENYPPEGSTTQVIPLRTLDDGTHLAVPLTDVTYSALNGPVSGISATGLITTLPVDEETSAMIRAVLTGVEGAVAELPIFVQDTLPDNYGTYAADGLPDRWQRQYFGPDNPLAAPLLDPDGDGQNNRFEYTAGLVPTDPLSRFQLRIAPVPGEPSWKKLILSPLVEGRRYEVKSNAGLADPWLPLSDTDTTDAGDERTVTDHEADPARKFYHVEITKP